jgi:hypothetical protein
MNGTENDRNWVFRHEITDPILPPQTGAAIAFPEGKTAGHCKPRQLSLYANVKVLKDQKSAI